MTPEQAAELRAPFPASAVGKLPKAGVQLDFVGHANITDRLLSVDPEWVWEPVAFNDAGEPLVSVVGKRCVMWVRLTVCGVTRLGVGTCPSTAFEPEKELIGDALRNAAMRFGVALDLWTREELESQHGPEPEPWWQTAGWKSEREHDRARDELRERSKALPQNHAEELRAWLKANVVNPMALTLTEYDQWASSLEEMEQSG